MPQLTLTGIGEFEIEEGSRLVLAVEEHGVHLGHRCGGKARCTTCRVRFKSGEPARMTRAEHDKLAERELLGEVRLSCQVLIEQDMEVEALMLMEEQGWADPGPEPTSHIEPEPEWMDTPRPA